MTYPVVPSAFSEDELRDHFILASDEFELLASFRREDHRLGFAVFLKTYQFLGYPPRRKIDIPPQIIEWIGAQVGLPSAVFERYRWRSRAWMTQLALLRKHTGLRLPEVQDRPVLLAWLVERCKDHLLRKELLQAAVRRCREIGLELPREKELRRLANSARRQFFHKLYEEVFARLDAGTMEHMERCLEPSEESGTTTYDWLKTPAGKLGKKTLKEELRKLEFLEQFTLNRARLFPDVPDKVFRLLRNRAQAEDAFQMRRHPPARRATLLCALLCARRMEVTDQVVRIFLALFRKVEKRGDAALAQEMAANLPKVMGKGPLLDKVVRAANDRPDAPLRTAIIEILGEERFQRMLKEAAGNPLSYELARAEKLEAKYRGYRRAMATVLETIELKTNNSKNRPLIDALALVVKYATTKHSYLPEHEKIPEELLTGSWQEAVLEEGPDGQRVRKRPFELCVLGKLEDALKCKEVWVEGAYRFRNPEEDLPVDWEHRRQEHYRKLALPLDAGAFLAPIRLQMAKALEDLNRYLARQRDGGVEIHHPGGGTKGIFHVPKLLKRPERPILVEIKERVIERWGVLNLLDILVEADRQVDFTRFFHTSGQRQVLDREEVRARVLLVLFALGTNLGLKRIHAATNPGCSYDDLRYFLSRFVSLETVRQTNIALVNRILALRNPRIWGRGTGCASDGKHLGAWEQNSITEWNSHYENPGVKAYWHVEKNSLCIHSMLQTATSPEVTSMLHGLVRHDTEMRVESNSVDSHGQSEVVFAFCRMLGVRLLPRLKRIREAKLYLPDKAMGSTLPRLAGVLADRRPIDWHLIEEHYDEMVRHVVAVSEGTGPTDSILRRFNRYNRASPLYRAFIELGKALKTIFLCDYLSRSELRVEIHDALQVVENWNSCVDFICFGRKTELATNDPRIQELIVACVHLLQNAVVLSNTLMVERVLSEHKLLERMDAKDLHALTPLFTSNVNPYGDFELNLQKPSFLEVA